MLFCPYANFCLAESATNIVLWLFSFRPKDDSGRLAAICNLPGCQRYSSGGRFIETEAGVTNGRLQSLSEGMKFAWLAVLQYSCSA